MAVITDTGTQGAKRRPPLGREMVPDRMAPDHEHPELMQRQGKVGDFMASLEKDIYGAERTMMAEREAAMRPHEAPGSPVGGKERERATRTAMMAKAAQSPAGAATEPRMAMAANRYTPIPITDPQGNPIPPDDPRRTGEDPTETDDTPEREGGPIPMTADVWQSQADAAEFERRLETLQSEQQITQLRDQAEHHRVQADLFKRQGESATEQATLADRSATERRETATQMEAHAEQIEKDAFESADITRYAAGERATILREEGAAQAAEARRAAAIAGMNADEKRAHFEAFESAANAQKADMEIEAMERQAQMRVAGAGRGAGGGVLDAQERSDRMQTARKVGQIGKQVEVRKKLRDIGVEIEETRETGFEKKAEHAETVSELRATLQTETARRQAILTEHEGSRKRQTMEDTAKRQKLAADLDANNATNLRIQSAQLFLRQDAQEKAQDYATEAANITDWALDNRPPIPDYVAIGKEQERQQAMRNLGTGLGIIGSAVNLARGLFGF